MITNRTEVLFVSMRMMTSGRFCLCVRRPLNARVFHKKKHEQVVHGFVSRFCKTTRINEHIMSVWPSVNFHSWASGMHLITTQSTRTRSKTVKHISNIFDNFYLEHLSSPTTARSIYHSITIIYYILALLWSIV